MSTDRAIVIIAVIIVGAALGTWRVRRALSSEALFTATQRRTGLAPDAHDVGPDALRLLQDLDAHLDAYFAGMSHLFEELGPPPADEAGLERLRAAVRDEQRQEGGP